MVGYNMIKLKHFIEYNENVSEINDIKELFLDFEDLKMDFYKIRNGNGEGYQKLFKIEYKTNRSGNHQVDIYCDKMFVYAITNDFKKDVKPRLIDMGYRIISIREKETNETVKKEIPVHGETYTSTNYDPIYKISILIKHEN